MVPPSPLSCPQHSPEFITWSHHVTPAMCFAICTNSHLPVVDTREATRWDFPAAFAVRPIRSHDCPLPGIVLDPQMCQALCRGTTAAPGLSQTLSLSWSCGPEGAKDPRNKPHLPANPFPIQSPFRSQRETIGHPPQLLFQPHSPQSHPECPQCHCPPTHPTPASL